MVVITLDCSRGKPLPTYTRGHPAIESSFDPATQHMFVAITSSHFGTDATAYWELDHPSLFFPFFFLFFLTFVITYGYT